MLDTRPPAERRTTGKVFCGTIRIEVGDKHSVFEGYRCSRPDRVREMAINLGALGFRRFSEFDHNERSIHCGIEMLCGVDMIDRSLNDRNTGGPTMCQ